MKNIAINALRLRQGGGVESYTLDLIHGFQQKGIRPTIYTSKADKNLPELSLVSLKTFPLTWLPKKLRPNFLSNKVRQYRQSDELILSIFFLYCDIFICGGNHLGYLNAIGKKPNLFERFIKIPHEKRVLQECKKVIAHSQLMKNELMEFYSVPEEKIAVLYPPVNTERFHTISLSERQALRQKLGFSENDIIYLFPSTGHKRKGFQLLKTFFNETDLPIKLVVAGTPVENSRNVLSLGFCKNMPELYQAADFTIMASNYEPFGLVGLESILSGTPIVFADNIACLETFKGDFGFTFNRSQTASLQEALEKSVQQVKSGKARIENPLACLTYNPELSVHMDQLLDLAN